MDFFRKKKDGKSKKQGKKDKNENSSPKGGSPAFGLSVKVTNENGQKGDKSQKETNVDRNNERVQSSQQMPPNYAESPSSEVLGLARTPEPDNEVVILNNRVLSPNGVQAYKQFNEVLHKMDRALETEESEDDMDASSLGLALKCQPAIDMSPQKGIQKCSRGHFQLAGVTTGDQDVDQHVVTPRTVPIIHVTQPSQDSMDKVFDVEATALKSPAEWDSEDVVNWCNSKGLTYFAELFEGCVDGASLLDLTEEDLIAFEIDDVGQRNLFLMELKELQNSLQVTPGGEVNPVLQWTNDDVLIWLEDVGLTRYLTIFRDYDVTGAQLMDLDMQMLDDLGIEQVHEREEFLAKFYELLQPYNITAKTEHEIEIEPEQYESVNAASENVTGAIQENYDDYRHNNTPAEELEENFVQSPVPAIQVPSPEPDEKIEEIWSLIESRKSVSEHQDSTDVSAEVSPRSIDHVSSLLSPEVDIDAEIEDMETTIAKLQSDLQRSKDTESEEHSSLVLKLSTAQNRLRSLHQQKSVMEDSSDESSKSQDATFEIHTSDLYQLMVDHPTEMVMVDIECTADGTQGFDVLEDEEHGGLVVTSCQSGLLLVPGDRLLEVNGYNISSSPLSVFEQFISANPPPLKLVVIRPKPESDDKEEELTDLKDDLSLVLKDLEVAVAENKELKNENHQLKSSLRDLQDEKSQHAMQVQMLQDQVEASENRWKDLRKTLVKMKNDQFDLETAFGPFSQWKPQTGTKADLDEALQTVNVLQKTLEEKHTALSNSKKEKNEYKKRLNQILNESTSSDLNYENLDDKLPIWESLASRSKTEVLQALKDNVLENERQKICFDQLLAVVMKRAPGLLQKVEVLNAIQFDDVKNRPEFQC